MANFEFSPNGIQVENSNQNLNASSTINEDENNQSILMSFGQYRWIFDRSEAFHKNYVLHLLRTQEEILERKFNEEILKQRNMLMQRHNQEMELVNDRGRYMAVVSESHIDTWKYIAARERQIIHSLQETVMYLEGRVEALESILEGSESEGEDGSDGSELLANEDEDENELIGKCRLCQRSKANIVLVPCLHLGLCFECNGNESGKEQPCFVCQTTCTSWIHVRLS